MENDNFHWRITIPANTTATAYMPAADKSHVTESGLPLENSEGATFYVWKMVMS
jgi:alpha-L-rhamnosidase